jgi:hypothetical protein
MPSNPDPIYTADNVHVAYELHWSVANFWKQPAPSPASWLQPLQYATETDGVRILDHRFTIERVRLTYPEGTGGWWNKSWLTFRLEISG